MQIQITGEFDRKTNDHDLSVFNVRFFIDNDEMTLYYKAITMIEDE